MRTASTVRKHNRRHVWLIAAAVCSTTAAQAQLRFEAVGDGIPAPLTGTPGDPQRGKAVAVNSDQGNCLICHLLPVAEAPVFGDLGPSLEGVGGRLSAAQLRLRIVDPKRLNPATVMPAYLKVDGLNRVAPRYVDKPILSAQEVEDLIAYLLTLTPR
jgi:L-cysteine S-thiosulfotransferase